MRTTGSCEPAATTATSTATTRRPDQPYEAFNIHSECDHAVVGRIAASDAASGPGPAWTSDRRRRRIGRRQHRLRAERRSRRCSPVIATPWAVGDLRAGNDVTRDESLRGRLRRRHHRAIAPVEHVTVRPLQHRAHHDAGSHGGDAGDRRHATPFAASTPRSASPGRPSDAAQRLRRLQPGDARTHSGRAHLRRSRRALHAAQHLRRRPAAASRSCATTYEAGVRGTHRRDGLLQRGALPDRTRRRHPVHRRRRAAPSTRATSRTSARRAARASS